MSANKTNNLPWFKWSQWKRTLFAAILLIIGFIDLFFTGKQTFFIPTLVCFSVYFYFNYTINKVEKTKEEKLNSSGKAAIAAGIIVVFITILFFFVPEARYYIVKFYDWLYELGMITW